MKRELNPTLKNVFAIAILVLATISNPVNAQSNKIEQAFSQSYYYEHISDYSSAITVIKNVYDFSSYEENLRLGWLTYKAQLYQESLKYYQNAMDIKPNSIEAKLGFAYPQAALGNMDKVIELYKNILQVDPCNSIVLYRLGSVYYDRKEYQAAYPYLEKVVELYPFSYSTTLLFAWTSLKLEKHKEARELFNSVLLYAPDDASAIGGLRLCKQ
ncbi:MAG: tetratricopeptide repeat protein [Bacteroidetes bacterium]|nr:tetratricopeptide repeat protein [Bacteroidota bacterium]